jgi:hypothetical protein
MYDHFFAEIAMWLNGGLGTWGTYSSKNQWLCFFTNSRLIQVGELKYEGFGGYLCGITSVKVIVIHFLNVNFSL